jgi:hypothetical protein
MYINFKAHGVPWPFARDSAGSSKSRLDSCQIQLTSNHGSGNGNWMSPDSSASRFSVARCCRIPALARFRGPTIAEFRQSNIKRVCKNETFNFEKRFKS